MSAWQNDVEGLLSDLEKLPASSTILRPSESNVEPVEVRPSDWLFRFWRDDWGMDVEVQPHLEMARFVQDALGDCTFSSETQTLIMLGVPRGTFKTTAISEATPTAVLTRNPNAKILLDGFRHSVSKARLRAVRRKIENDACLDEKYGTMAWRPQFRADTWNNEEIVITARTDLMSREASIATAGVDRSMNSQHFDLIIPDDVVTDTNVRTPDSREQVYQHILDLIPILNPGGVMVVVFTTWHIDDAYMRLIRIDQDRERRGLPPKFRKLIRGCYDGPTGLYFPKRQSHEFLEETRETMGARKFAAQYLLKPIADEDKTFNMDALRLRPFSFFSTPERLLGGVIRPLDVTAQLTVETTIALDPAGRKPNKTTDSHGITVVCTDLDDRWWVAEAMGLKAPPAAILDRMCRLILMYRPWTVSVEDAFGSGLWIDMLAQECERRGIAVRFTEYHTKGVPKEERIVLLQPRWEAGKIIVRADSKQPEIPMHLALIEQLDKFSMGGIDHEDILDSLVQHLSLTRKPDAVPLPSIEPNPLDGEYHAFRERQQRERQLTGSRTGRFGPVWGA